ncbi:ABC transporter permease [Alicyclobacillus cycloheptanicus]|uniref:Peptide/nickel transport system permease protein n=1 Tax=Alicyclobacillus cycloheptanicus TaxID=1457 RepID=A0ABT9XFT1_9BACL|nr:ABC transporter permease [Alicyclobacillus cycloheptanicus]MDQ0189161.1 peptide/nickel transport system permease protein [Alicyclobacillus cycloheptanicus]
MNPDVLNNQSTDAAVGTASQVSAWRRFWRYPLSSIGVAGFLLLVLFSFVGPLIYHVSPIKTNLLDTMLPPSAQFPLGTDDMGHSVLARLMWGGRSSLEVGVVSAFVAMVFGTLYGMVSAMSGKWVDMILMRIVDVMLSIPTIFLLLFLDAVFTPNVPVMIIVIASTAWLGTARLVRAEVLKIKTELYVEAANIIGVGTWRLMMRYLFPNFLGTVLVVTTFGVADAILTLASLSFLGFGLAPPAPNWGGDLSTAMNYMSSWWLVYPPGILIVIALLSVNFIGDGIRHAVETRAN